jgi:ribosome biogenesis protein BRX1
LFDLSFYDTQNLGMGKKAARTKRPREEAEEPVVEKVPVTTSTEETPAVPEEMLIKEPDTIQRTLASQKATNKQKCLVLGSRNMNGKDRHLLLDLRGLMPHSREHAKLAAGDDMGDQLTELASLHHCNSVMFVEAHRHDVAYMWLGQSPAGPSVKLQLNNIHTADSLRMAGNSLKYSRPLLHFDREFETIPHLRLVKSLLQLTFNTPRYHPKSKPFVDHVLSFMFLDGHIWFRNYQIVDNGNAAPSLLEIGPRFTMEPISIFNGCCKGSVLWKNPDAQAPTEVRRSRKLRQMLKAKENAYVKEKSEKHKEMFPQPADSVLDQVFL